VELGIAPLLYGIAQGRTGTAVPELHVRNLGMEYARTWAINTKNKLRIAEMLAAFGSAGIRAIPLKGAHLALFVYRDIGMRPMVDVDILVRREDIPTAEKLLSEAGYATREHIPSAYKFLGVDGDAGAPEHLIERYRNHHHHLHPLGSARGIRLLDVHWTLVSPALPFRIDAEGLWQRAGIQALDGREVRVLCPEDTILHCALHASFCDKFRFHGLRPLCDLAAVVGRFHDTLDWDALSARAREWNADRFVYLALRLSGDLLGVNIPDAALALLKPAHFDEAIAGEAARRVLGCEDRRAAIRRPEMFDPSRGLGAKTAYVLGRIFPRRGEMARIYSLPVSSPLLYLGYPRRLASLLSRYPALYARFFLHLLRGGKPDPFGYNLDTWLSNGSVSRGH
jgi:hypothetical protein